MKRKFLLVTGTVAILAFLFGSMFLAPPVQASALGQDVTAVAPDVQVTVVPEVDVTLVVPETGGNADSGAVPWYGSWIILAGLGLLIVILLVALIARSSTPPPPPPS